MRALKRSPVSPSTGGTYLQDSYTSPYKKLGTNFIVPTCARSWARANTTGGSFGYNQYFNPAAVA